MKKQLEIDSTENEFQSNSISTSLDSDKKQILEKNQEDAIPQNNVEAANDSNNLTTFQDTTINSQQIGTVCLICFDKTPNAVLMPCGHGGLCKECAQDIWTKSCECYLCRNQITSICLIETELGLGKFKPILKTITQNVQEVSFISEKDQSDLEQS